MSPRNSLLPLLASIRPCLRYILLYYSTFDRGNLFRQFVVAMKTYLLCIYFTGSQKNKKCVVQVYVQVLCTLSYRWYNNHLNSVGHSNQYSYTDDTNREVSGVFHLVIPVFFGEVLQQQHTRYSLVHWIILTRARMQTMHELAFTDSYCSHAEISY